MDYDVKAPDLIVSERRHDVTEEVEAFMRSEGWMPPLPSREEDDP